MIKNILALLGVVLVGAVLYQMLKQTLSQIDMRAQQLMTDLEERVSKLEEQIGE